MKTGFIFLLPSCVQIPTAIEAFYHVWKSHNVQRARSEMRRCTTHGLYQSKLWQQDHCQNPQNANPDGSTLEGTAQRIGRLFGGGEAEVLSESHIMPPHIFEVGLKVNAKVYLDVLNSLLIPWCNQVAGGRLWEWQQNSALAYKSKETQAWLQKVYYDFVPFSHWAPSSPDLNPLDYFVWSYVENITNMTSHNTKASLIAAIRRVFAELQPALVEKAYSQFRIRIEAVVEAEGGYIEYMSALLHNQVSWIDFFNKSFKIKL